MQRTVIHQAILAAALVAIPSFASAATFNYGFNNLTAGTVPAGNAVGTGVSYLGTQTIGQTGPDNWVWTSGSSFPTGESQGVIVRNDVRAGFTGNWASAYPTATGATVYDSINSRKNDANFTYSIPAATKFSVAFNGSIVATPNGAATTYSRAEMALGYDQSSPTVVGTPDGKIRSTSATAENAEWAPFFGYDSSGGGEFYVRPAALGTAVVTVAPITGTYRFELDIDPTTNASTTVPGAFDGSGTLMIQQLFDANGVAVVDTLHAASAALTNVNLGLSRMTVAANGGTPGGWNPANWNGMIIRESINGGIDNIAIATVPEPASLAALGLGATALLRRRRAR